MQKVSNHEFHNPDPCPFSLLKLSYNFTTIHEVQEPKSQEKSLSLLRVYRPISLE